MYVFSGTNAHIHTNTHTHTHTCTHTAEGSKSIQYGAPAITGEGSESDRQAFCRKGHNGLTAGAAGAVSEEACGEKRC